MSSTLSHATRHAALGLVLAMVLISALLFRSHRAGQRAMTDSDVAFDRGQLTLSVAKAADALRWYFPFADHVTAARSRLVAVAEGAEASGDLPLALTAWSALRAALNETAHPLAASDALLERSNRAIVRLLPKPGGLMTPAPDSEQLLAAYAKSERREPVFYLARTAGMALLLLGVWLAFLRGKQQGLALGLGCLAFGLFAWIFAALGA